MVPCILVDVEYRRSPEHKFSASNEDAKTVVAWVAANKSSLGGVSSSKIGVSGDSNGGRLAAVVCYDLPRIVDFAERSKTYCEIFKEIQLSFSGFVLKHVIAFLVVQLYFANDRRRSRQTHFYSQKKNNT
ncbi:hypothetical protein DPMN_134464 [Dreissena polymorpha]|uniref:Alpha/beta hydrolase fold-3 domain-containing protein n=1 Tax=Dreissena polymorpha TaxID=45954 RepID=A0A9D4JDU7_DREPO|nr:hypothetical protein DPMN_134464 [Dreissena polymorpha]